MVAYVHINTSFTVSHIISVTWSGDGSDYRN